MKDSRTLSTLAHDMSRRTGMDYNACLAAVTAQHPGLASALPNQPSATELANDRASADRLSAARKKNNARTEFINAVQKYEDTYKVSYDQARATIRRKPEFANTIAEMEKPLPPAKSSGAADRVFNMQQCVLLGLGTMDQPEANAAFHANGDSFTPLNHQAVMDGLVNYHAGEDKISAAAAETKVRQRHERLATAVDALKTS